jgi:hypothetical protein
MTWEASMPSKVVTCACVPRGISSEDIPARAINKMGILGLVILDFSTLIFWEKGGQIHGENSRCRSGWIEKKVTG